MQPTLPLAISFSLLLAPVYGQEMKVGQMVIAIENADLQTADGSTVNVYPGLSLTIQEMEVVATEQGTTKTRILVSYRRLGWLDKQAVRLPDDALKFFELQSEQKPDRAVWKIASGMTLAATGKHEPAIVVLSKVLESNPDSISALNERAFSLMQLGQYERATKDFDSLIEKQPQAIFYNNRALCHQASNDLVAAKHDFAKALELDTKLVHLHMPLASIETGPGKPRCCDGAPRQIHRTLSTLNVRVFGTWGKSICHAGISLPQQRNTSWHARPTPTMPICNVFMD